MCNHDQIVEMPILAVDYRINWGKRIYPAEIDACLAPLLFKLHKQGILTLHSCCRHGTPLQTGEGHIMIDHTSVRKARSLGYDVVRSWNPHPTLPGEWRYEIRFPENMIGKANHSLEDFRQKWDETIGEMLKDV